MWAFRVGFEFDYVFDWTILTVVYASLFVHEYEIHLTLTQRAKLLLLPAEEAADRLTAADRFVLDYGFSFDMLHQSTIMGAESSVLSLEVVLHYNVAIIPCGPWIISVLQAPMGHTTRLLFSLP
ncbi:hypothetical protein NC653_039346 [Populus alba x Populus x berolinensis]|uniref:Uncharacterized protein n=1 Tax=Populus alba x Populus x berolinensis TaxID=444605 RepID=A0AAD6LBS7_9ROSI|nr:hypothetical protein NC653_039346 [Populus alba x Populus x berolinensis]